jgi:hypothetical protein
MRHFSSVLGFSDQRFRIIDETLKNSLKYFQTKRMTNKFIVLQTYFCEEKLLDYYLTTVIKIPSLLYFVVHSHKDFSAD